MASSTIRNGVDASMRDSSAKNSVGTLDGREKHEDKLSQAKGSLPSNAVLKSSSLHGGFGSCHCVDGAKAPDGGTALQTPQEAVAENLVKFANVLQCSVVFPPILSDDSVPPQPDGELVRGLDARIGLSSPLRRRLTRAPQGHQLQAVV